MNSRRLSRHRSFFVVVMLAQVAATAPGATIVVTNTSDFGPGSLRQAVAGASTGDTIIFTNTLSGSTITLTSGEIFISKNLTIDASPLPQSVKVRGNGTSRLFGFEHCTNTLVGLTLTNGASLGGHPDDFGGALYLVSATLTVSNCVLAGNRAVYGGAIYNEDSKLTIYDSIFTNNAAGAWGGGITCDGSTLVVHNSTFTGNSASDGGAIASINSGPFTINRSTLVGNYAMNVGGVCLFSGTLDLNNSTLTGNSAGNGGAVIIAPTTTLTINNSTVVGNSATNFGGGIYNNLGTANLTNSIVAANAASNISGSSAGANNFIGGDPLLAALGNYGGPTQTMPPLPGSPATDNGSDGVTNFFTVDQRGSARLLGMHVDIGAVEGTFNPNFSLVNVMRSENGSFQFGFENLAGASFRVRAAAEINLPLTNWTMIGFAFELPANPGQFQFIDPEATNHSARFYRVGFP
jgi:hypothetical protein